FSSRRRHTRFSRDWSSDVCSSDLELVTDIDAKNKLSKQQKSGDLHATQQHQPVKLSEYQLVGTDRLNAQAAQHTASTLRGHTGRSEARRVGQGCTVAGSRGKRSGE